MPALHNKVNRAEMRQRLMEEKFQRVTLSFYRYVRIADPAEMRNRLWQEWNELQVFGRVYLAHEGINAQISVPQQSFDEFRKSLDGHPEFKDVPFKIAVEDDGKSFYILTVKVRRQIVADGIPEGAFDVTNVGHHLDAIGFNEAMEDPDAVVVDMRNHYESEVGHFENAILPQSDTFKEELPLVLEELKGMEDRKILMYCTGGIRCEKASAWLKHHGFKNVSQLYGGIIEYARQVKQSGLPSKFIGKNFVFDERLGERITNEVIANCHFCGSACDMHANCANTDCHLLFIQCGACAERLEGCCSEDCLSWKNLPEVERETLLAKGISVGSKQRYFRSLRPFPSKIEKAERRR